MFPIVRNPQLDTSISQEVTYVEDKDTRKPKAVRHWNFEMNLFGSYDFPRFISTWADDMRFLKRCVSKAFNTLTSTSSV